MEPSRISDDRNIKVVFFKENLSTGWDCPRAETMMSFRRANDATYIAQLLGRMVRTPMQMHINVDDSLNDVHLYLPYFDQNTVNDIVEQLNSVEGGAIPTDIDSEQIGEKKVETLSVRPRKRFVTPTSSPAGCRCRYAYPRLPGGDFRLPAEHIWHLRKAAHLPQHVPFRHGSPRRDLLAVLHREISTPKHLLHTPYKRA